MTNVKNEKFHAKIIKISNFELQKSYIPQKKAENFYNTVSPRKNKKIAKKVIYCYFFYFSRHARGPPKILDVQFFENFKKKFQKWLARDQSNM